MKRPNREPTAYAEIGGYMYETEGNAKVKLQTSVNKPLKLDDADRVTKINKVRVEMHVSEDKSVQDNQVYEKDIKMKQISNNGDASDGTNFDEDSTPSKSNGGLENSAVYLKNMIDNVLARLDTERTGFWIAIIATALVAAFALGLAVMR